MPVNVNGVISGDCEARISVFDHGFLYGDSVYETLKTFERKPFLMAEHFRRLRNSAQAIGMEIPWDDDALAGEVRRTLGAFDATEYYIRLIVTRGEGEIGYGENPLQKPTLVIIARPFKSFPAEWYRSGITVVTASLLRNPVRSLNPANKTSNLLNSRLAYMEAARRGGQEALLLNMEGHLTECSASNVFFVKKGALATPALDVGLLAGITRRVVLELAEELGIETQERTLTREEGGESDEAFITSTLKDIMPVARMDEIAFAGPVPGPITARLMSAFREYVKRVAAER